MKRVELLKSSVQVMRSKLHGIMNEVMVMDEFLKYYDPERAENFNLETLQEKCIEYYFDLKRFLIDIEFSKSDGTPYQKLFNRGYFISILRKENKTSYVYRQISYFTDKGFGIFYKKFCSECPGHPAKKLFDLIIADIQRREEELENSILVPGMGLIKKRFEYIPGIHPPMGIPGKGFQPDLKLP